MECLFTYSILVRKGPGVHDDVIKWKHFPCNWPFVRGTHRSPVNSPHKGQWRGALMFSLICVWINGWVNNREAGNLRRYHAHYDVTVMMWVSVATILTSLSHRDTSCSVMTRVNHNVFSDSIFLGLTVSLTDMLAQHWVPVELLD